MYPIHLLIWLGREMDMDDDYMDDGVDVMMLVCLRQLTTQRYSVPQMQQIQQFNQFEEDLCEDDIPFLNQNKLHQKYQMKRESFNELVEMVQGHPIFNHG